jgi:hypothetical protein
LLASQKPPLPGGFFAFQVRIQLRSCDRDAF